MEKQEMENGNGREEWKWTWKMEKFIARKDKGQTCMNLREKADSGHTHP